MLGCRCVVVVVAVLCHDRVALATYSHRTHLPGSTVDTGSPVLHLDGLAGPHPGVRTALLELRLGDVNHTRPVPLPGN